MSAAGAAGTSAIASATTILVDMPLAMTVSAEVAAGNLLRVLEGLGPDQSGGFFDWMGEVVPW